MKSHQSIACGDNFNPHGGGFTIFRMFNRQLLKAAVLSILFWGWNPPI